MQLKCPKTNIRITIRLNQARVEEYKHDVASINTVVEGVPQSFVAIRLLSFR